MPYFNMLEKRAYKGKRKRRSTVSVTDVNSLLYDLERKYGITMTRSGLLTHIKNSTLYYDKILDYVYKDYETYYQDI